MVREVLDFKKGDIVTGTLADGEFSADEDSVVRTPAQEVLRWKNSNSK